MALPGPSSTWGLLFLFLLGLLNACSRYPTFVGPHARIETAPGPEDIALDTSFGMQRIIASCSERRTADHTRNGFYAFDIRSKNLTRLQVSGLPEDVQLRPHGIDIAMVNGIRTLYCVNHEKNALDFPPAGRQSILVFELKDHKVVFREQLTHPLMVSPNDVCTDHSGGLFVSIDSGKINSKWEKIVGLRRSYVLHYNGKDWQQVGGKLKYANGVGLHDGRIYITATQEKTIVSYRMDPDGSFSDREEYRTTKGNDNITFSDNRLITTAHLDFLAFLKHVKHETEPSPCMVYAMDLKTHQMDTLYLDDGTVMSAASTGLIYNDVLYVSQIFNPYIIAIPLAH